MAKRNDKIICDNSYCGRIIPEQRFDCGRHNPPKELKPFVEANKRRSARHDRGEGLAGELWSPQKAHQYVHAGKFPRLTEE